MTVLAYEMQCLDQAPFNFYEDAPREICCPACDRVVDRNYAPADLGRIAYGFDATYTYDGHTLISERFKDFLSELCPGKVGFVEVNRAPPIYELRPTETWSVDLDPFLPGFRDRCESCGLFAQANQPPLSRMPQLAAPVQEGIYVVDTSFVDRKDRTPPIIVGLRTKELIERQQFQRVRFFPIDDAVPPEKMFDPENWSRWTPDWDAIMLEPGYEPLPDRVPPMPPEDLAALLERPAAFRCTPCLPGEPHADRWLNIAVEHSAEPGASPDRIPESWPPSLRSLLSWHNGLTLFQGPPDEQFGSGFQFYSVADAIAELKNLQRILHEGLEQSVDGWDHPAAEAWLDGLMPIGASVMSADYVVIDTLRRRQDGECPVLLLDHDAYFVGAGSPANSKELASNVLSLLGWMLQDPVDLLVSHWRYRDADGAQWYPVKALFGDQAT